jgi:AcrR family transcriptional regulator
MLVQNRRQGSTDMPLSDTRIKSAEPQDKLFKLSDGGGLQLWVWPDGSKRWRLAYRFNGKQKLLALGVYSQTGLREARAARDRAKRTLANGNDPSVTRRAEKADRTLSIVNTFEAVANRLIAKKHKKKRAGVTSKRRMGPENSVTRGLLMDGTEAVMLEQGYAALTSRSVAERVGLAHQLVYYYFQTMDDLIVASFRRRMETFLRRLEDALKSQRPLHAYWEVSADPPNGAIAKEYMALANHNERVRRDMIMYGERSRQIAVEALSERLRQVAPEPTVFTPYAILMAINSMALIINFDSSMGMASGHNEMQALVEWCLSRLEPDSAPVAMPKTARAHSPRRFRSPVP